jgi:hypothetical protein
MKQIRIIIAGSKSFNNYKILSKALDKYIDELSPVYRRDIELISGAERMVASIVEQYTLDHGHNFRAYEAYWDDEPENAGYYRNNAMFKHASKGIGVLFIFWDGKSKSVKNLVELAQHYGVEIHVERY